MKIFITGGTGYLGATLVEHLVQGGHAVHALARSDDAAQRLVAAGATPVRGDLSATGVLESAAAEADAIVHAAVDYAQTDAANATELAAVAALVAGAGAAGTGKPVIYTSTGLVYGSSPDRREDAELPDDGRQPVKAQGERLVLQAPGITGVVVRAGLITGRGGSRLITQLIAGAVASGRVTYIEDGSNSWTPVDVDDLADLYSAILAAPVAGIYNAVGDNPFTFRQLAEAIAALTGATPTSLPMTTAEQTMGQFAHVLASTSTLPTEKVRSTYDWTPSGISLPDDVRSGSYRIAE